jgi:hypothetical protein
MGISIAGFLLRCFVCLLLAGVFCLLGRGQIICMFFFFNFRFFISSHLSFASGWGSVCLVGYRVAARPGKRKDITVCLYHRDLVVC